MHRNCTNGIYNILHDEGSGYGITASPKLIPVYNDSDMIVYDEYKLANEFLDLQVLSGILSHTVEWYLADVVVGSKWLFDNNIGAK